MEVKNATVIDYAIRGDFEIFQDLIRGGIL